MEPFQHGKRFTLLQHKDDSEPKSESSESLVSEEELLLPLELLSDSDSEQELVSESELSLPVYAEEVAASLLLRRGVELAGRGGTGNGSLEVDVGLPQSGRPSPGRARGGAVEGSFDFGIGAGGLGMGPSASEVAMSPAPPKYTCLGGGSAMSCSPEERLF